jgi:hypothetical protein
VIDAYAPAFTVIGGVQTMVFVWKAPGGLKLNIFAMGCALQKRFTDLPTAPDARHDLPLQLVASLKYASAFVFMRAGFLYLIEYDRRLFSSARACRRFRSRMRRSRGKGACRRFQTMGGCRRSRSRQFDR